MKRLIKRAIIVLVALGFIGGAGAWYFRNQEGEALSLRIAQVKRGDLLVTISATGTVEPEEVVDVGAQVAGQILAFGIDAEGKTVDYGSPVKQGTVLARIDDSLYVADEALAAAQVQSAKAGLQRAKADLDQMKAKLRQAELDWQRARKLGPSEALSQASYDAYQSAYETAKANVAVGEAAILQSQAAVAQYEAALRRARRSLGYCTITSPVKGVIVDRRVNIGQTVVASLNAPSLFLIAKDLKRMQVWVAVNEADIGKIRPGQPVKFTVDAFPGETFRGEVGKVRLNATMTQNVVTYTVEIITDNSNGRLLPYLTANVQFEVNRLSQVLQVPNTALRWKPSAEMVAPQYREGAQAASAPQERPADKKASASRRGQNERRGVVWVPEGKLVRPVSVKVGLTDGSFTAVEGTGLKENMEIVTGLQAEKAAPTAVNNPFTPKRPGSSGNKSR